MLQYHNITPAAFFAPYDRAAVPARGARAPASWRSLVGHVDLALGDSEFNRQELEALGFAPTGVLPIAVDTARITDAPRRPALEKILGDGLINMLFVGRIVPNKRIEDHIRLAELYKRYVDSYYRFIFVGRYDGVPRYYAQIRALIVGVPDAAGSLLVHRTGAGRGSRRVLSLGGRLRVAQRARGLLRAARRGDGGGRAGSGVRRGRGSGDARGRRRAVRPEGPRVRCRECSALLVYDRALRERVLEGQRRRLQDFTPAAIDARLGDVLGRITG